MRLHFSLEFYLVSSCRSGDPGILGNPGSPQSIESLLTVPVNRRAPAKDRHTSNSPPPRFAPPENAFRSPVRYLPSLATRRLWPNLGLGDSEIFLIRNPGRGKKEKKKKLQGWTLGSISRSIDRWTVWSGQDGEPFLSSTASFFFFFFFFAFFNLPDGTKTPYRIHPPVYYCPRSPEVRWTKTLEAISPPARYRPRARSTSLIHHAHPSTVC